MKRAEIRMLLQRRSEREERAAERLRQTLSTRKAAAALLEQARRRQAMFELLSRQRAAELYDDAAGRILDLAQLDRLTNTVDALATQASELAQRATQATEALQNADTEMTAARADYSARRRESEKWRLLAARRAQAEEGLERLLNEIELEERAIAHHAGTVEGDT